MLLCLLLLIVYWYLFVGFWVACGFVFVCGIVTPVAFWFLLVLVLFVAFGLFDLIRVWIVYFGLCVCLVACFNL